MSWNPGSITTVRVVHGKRYESHGIRDAEVFAAFSRKELKGTHFEIRIPDSEVNTPADVLVNGQRVPLEKISLQGKSYWIGTYINNSHNSKTITASPRFELQLVPAKKTCVGLLRAA